MAKARAKAGKGIQALSPRQQRVKDLLDAQPDLSANEIAKHLGTSPSAIYQQLSRLRAKGYAVKARSNGRANGGTHKAESSQAQERPIEHKGNPVVSSRSVEEHVTDELHEVTDRLNEIADETGRLEEERSTLVERQTRLAAARDALAAA